MLVFHENLLNAVIERGGDGKETPMYYIRSLYLEKLKWMNIKGYEQENSDFSLRFDTLVVAQVDYD